MEKLEKVHGLMDELTEAVKELFPDLSNIRVSSCKDGYMSIDVVERADEELAADEDTDTPYKFLLSQCRINGKWTDDWSERQNKYLAEHGLLLEVG